MTHPQRIQRQRTKGYKQPEGTIYCGRPTKWGNPYSVVSVPEGWSIRLKGYKPLIGTFQSKHDALVACCLLYRAPSDLSELRHAKYLSCWCPLDMPCHVDVIIELLKEQG